MSKTNLIIAGAGGRMGRTIIATALGNAKVTIVGAFDAKSAPSCGVDVGVLVGKEELGVSIGDMMPELAPPVSLADSVIIDFTVPAASMDIINAAHDAGCGLVIGTTGFSPDQEAVIAEVARHIAIVKSGNMSLGVNLLAGLVRKAAAQLSEDFDIEIFEGHHRHKVDAPSGTAILLGDAAAKGRDVSLDEVAAHDRQGARKPGDIGFSVLRGGGIIGDHDVSFVSDAEVLTLSHRAIDRTLFARGAVAAALWVADKKPGLYSMEDVLDL